MWVDFRSTVQNQEFAQKTAFLNAALLMLNSPLAHFASNWAASGKSNFSSYLFILAQDREPKSGRCKFPHLGSKNRRWEIALVYTAPAKFKCKCRFSRLLVLAL